MSQYKSLLTAPMMPSLEAELKKLIKHYRDSAQAYLASAAHYDALSAENYRNSDAALVLAAGLEEQLKGLKKDAKDNHADMAGSGLDTRRVDRT